MYRPRRVGRGTTAFLPTRGRRCLCARGAQATLHPTVSDRRREQPSTAGRIDTMFGLQELQLKEHITNLLRRDPSPRWWRLRPIAHCVIRRPCYLQIRNASTPPSPTRPRRRGHGRTLTCPNRKRPARPSETRRRHCSRSDRTSRGKRWPLGRRHAAPFCSTRSTASRREKPVDAPMHAPAVLHAITRTHALHVNADRQSQRDRACALLVLVCLRLGFFSSGFRLGVRACVSSSLSVSR